jgi:branched-chain amino acid transport system ATP-binding protein
MTTPSASDRTGLRVDGLAAGYDGLAVVRDVTIDVARGEIVAILGPNGAGKTTLLTTIAGLLSPIAGRVMIDGADLSGLAPHRVSRRGVTLVPDDRGVLFDLSVGENLTLDAGTAVRDRAVELFPELDPLLERRAGLLSGGEQQMLAIGRAVARRPAMLLIDEMSHGLAPIVVERILPVLRAAADAGSCGILVVEQHVGHALAVADRAVVLSHGRTVLEGSCAAFRADTDAITRAYLGGAPGR